MLIASTMMSPHHLLELKTQNSWIFFYWVDSPRPVQNVPNGSFGWGLDSLGDEDDSSMGKFVVHVPPLLVPNLIWVFPCLRWWSMRQVALSTLSRKILSAGVLLSLIRMIHFMMLCWKWFNMRSWWSQLSRWISLGGPWLHGDNFFLYPRGFPGEGHLRGGFIV